MRWFRTKQFDERIENLKNKLYKEVYVLVVVICSASIVIKSILNGYVGIAPIITELVIFLLAGLYYMFRSTRLGLYADEVEVHDRNSKLPMTAKHAVIGLSFGLAVAIYFGARSVVLYAEGILQSVWYFLLVSFASLMIYLPLFVGGLLLLHVAARTMSRRSQQISDE